MSKALDKALKMLDGTAERKRAVIKLYESGKIPQDVFGQLAMANFSNKIIQRAIERKWIDAGLGKQLLSI